MRKLAIYGLQMPTTINVSQNVKLIKKHIPQAKEAGADFLQTPEGSVSGYYPDFDLNEVADAVLSLADIARQNELGLFLGTCYKKKESQHIKIFNQIRTYSSRGNLISEYSKIMNCHKLDDQLQGMNEDSFFEEGRLTSIILNDIRVGFLICNDLWVTPGYTMKDNIYLPYQLKKMGVEVIVHSTNTGEDPFYTSFHEESVKLWAQCLKMHIVETNASNGKKPVTALSGVVNPEGVYITTAKRRGIQNFFYEIKI
jgi:predicted amidohydrolase